MPEKFQQISFQQIPHETVHLDEFQRWMVAVVTNFGNDTEAWNSAAAVAELSHERALGNVLPSKMLTEYERVGIYRRMYFLRMRDALEIDFPSVLHFVGKPAFEALVEDYFTQFPSNSYTLNNTGTRFPAFMRASNHSAKEFIAELAELELAINAVMEAEEVPPIAPDEIAAIPPEAWSDARFEPVAAFKLHESAYPVHEYLRALEEETSDFPSAELRPNYAYIHRSDFHTNHYALDVEEYRLLQHLSTGTPLGEAFEAIQQQLLSEQKNIEELLPRITTCFQEWMAKGVFARVVV
jgi:hypothetical protein